MESLLAAGDGVKLDEDVALAVGVDSNVNDLAVLLVALSLDFDLEVFDPVVTPVALFPENVLASVCKTGSETYSSASKTFSIARTYADAASGDPLALVGSTGLIEIAIRDGNAARDLDLRRGSQVVLT